MKATGKLYKQISFMAGAFALSQAANAGYYQFTNDDGKGIAFETNPSYLQQCKGGKYSLCYEGDISVTFIGENNHTFAIADGELQIGRNDVKYKAKAKDTEYNNWYVDELEIEFKVKKDKNGELNAELDITLEAENLINDDWTIDFDESYSAENINREFSLRPPAEVPVPTAGLLFGSGLALMGVVGRSRSRAKTTQLQCNS